MNINRLKTSPVKIKRTTRRQNMQGMTSGPAGKFVPIARIPLLREDSLSAVLSFNVEMAETKEMLMNGAYCRIRAFLVPMLAMERFEGSRDQMDRSYQGEPKVDGGAVVPFIETEAAGTVGSRAVYKALGLHAAPADLTNTAYLEAYNAVWNYLAKQKSLELTPRARLLDTLAPAFWLGGRMANVVPDFDQAAIDGEVALNVVEGKLPVKGLAMYNTVSFAGAAGAGYNETGHAVPAGETGWSQYVDGAGPYLKVKGNNTTKMPEVFAEMAANGITVSLSNLEMARKTQAWAKLREQYNGHEEWIIDAYMSGHTMPDQYLKQPMLLADKTVPFMQAKRYATDSGNLADSAVSGAAHIELHLGVPKLATGGVVLVFMECLPEQLYERQRDPYFHTTHVEQFPEAVRDSLDPEKVDVVLNGEVDTAHATPALTFGYEPLNARWSSWGPSIGGKFMRGVGSDTVRKRLWGNETSNPTLGPDFYLATTVNQKPFLDEVSDPFEVAIEGVALIQGNTQQGRELVEASDNYEQVADKAPTDRIVKA